MGVDTQHWEQDVDQDWTESLTSCYTGQSAPSSGTQCACTFLSHTVQLGTAATASQQYFSSGLGTAPHR